MPKHPPIYLAFILIYFVALGLAYAQAVPIFEASDEAEHVIYVHTILETGALPVIQSSEQMNQQTDPIARWNNQAHHAPLYYLLGAAAISWSERDDLADYLIPNELIFLRNTTEDNANKWLHLYGEPRSDTHQAVFALRLLSIAIGCGTLLLVYGSARQVFEGALWPLIATLFTASIPTFIVVNSSASNDPLTILLYTGGLGWALKVWRSSAISWRDTWLISAILAGITLTKLTGVSLFGVVYGVLLVGAWRNNWSWRVVVRVMAISLIMTALVAGWWYVRNWQLYGDPLALAATQSIWGRSDPLTWAVFRDDLLRIGKSFWMMVGYLHEPVYTTDTFYDFTLVVTALGFLGVAAEAARRRGLRAPSIITPATIQNPLMNARLDQGDVIDHVPLGMIGIMGFACLVVAGMLLYGTRSVDISYGRLLHPALGAFVLLMLIGWRSLVGHWGGLLVLPFVVFAIATPLHTIPQAYPRLELVETIPQAADTIGWQAESLELVALDLHQQRVQPDETLTLDLYFRGSHPDNPALLVTAADSLRATRLGHVEIYPGMAATNSLAGDHLYRVPIAIPLDDVPDAIRQPRYVALLVEWVNLEDNQPLIFDSGESLYEVMQTTFVDPRYEAQSLDTSAAVTFGDFIQLESYALSTDDNANLNIAFVWRPLRDIPDDWTLTVQAFDDAGDFIGQIDEMPYWYPTSAWAAGVAFNDARTLMVPNAAEIHDIRIGWYRQGADGTFQRLPVRGGSAVDDLYQIRVADGHGVAD